MAWLAQDYLRKHPDCEVYTGQDESLDMKAIREQMEAAHRNTHMEVEDIELVEENPLNNDADFATTTAAMDSAGGKSSPESNRK